MRTDPFHENLSGKRMNPDTVVGLNKENQVCNVETNKTLSASILTEKTKDLIKSISKSLENN